MAEKKTDRPVKAAPSGKADKAYKLDFKKEQKELYQPKTTPTQIQVPEMGFIMVNGVGAPEGEAYQGAMQLLYTLTFTIKMSKMGGEVPPGYQDYVLPPLEGLWQGDVDFDAATTARETWRWTSMIRQPDFVTAEVFEWAKQRAAKKDPALPLEKAYFKRWEEGLCVQMMHIGPYADEPASMAQMEAYMAQNGLAIDYSDERCHHEIYLGDPRKIAPEKRKTVLRTPVRPL